MSLGKAKPDLRFVDIWSVSYDPNLAKALGDVVVVWAYAETSMVLALSRLTGIPVNRATVGYYRIPTFESRVKFIRSLIPGWRNTNFTEADKATIDEHVAKLNILSRTRNHWVHGVWCRQKDTMKTIVFNFRAMSGSKNKIKPVKAGDVAAHIALVKTCARELQIAVKQHELPRE